MNLEDVTAILRAHVDPGLRRSISSAAPSVQPGDVVRRREAGRAASSCSSSSAGPLPPVSSPWTDREQEYDVLRALGGHGLPVPGVLAIGVDERPFLVMERLPGAPPGRLAAEERRTLGRELGILLARLHALDPRKLGLAAAESPSEATLAQVRHYQRLYESARPAPVPLLGALLAWAERNCPQDGIAPAVLWGDPGAHNMLVADGQSRSPRPGAHARRIPARRPRRRGLELPWIVDPDDVVAGYEEVSGAIDRQRLTYFVALASATRSVMVVNGTAAWIDGDVSSPANAALGLELLALDLARGARAAGWGDLPPSDGQPPSYPLRSGSGRDGRGSAAGCSMYLAPTLEDRRLRQMTKRAAALLATTAGRIPPPPGSDPAAAEREAVAAEQAGGDAAIRNALLVDLAREIQRLEPLARLHGHPPPFGRRANLRKLRRARRRASRHAGPGPPGPRCSRRSSAPAPRRASGRSG